MMRILHLVENHPILVDQLTVLGFENIVDTLSSKEARSRHRPISRHRA